MRSRACTALPLAALLFLVAATRRDHPQQPAQTPAIQGTFVYDASASDDVEAAIKEATHKMSFITKPIARGRLKKTNEPYRRVIISPTAAEISIAMDQRAPIVTPSDGTAIDWKRPEDGEMLKVSTSWEGDRLRETFVADDGQRENVFSLSPDGRTLRMDVTVSSPRLPAPVRYALVYRREG